MVLLPEVSECTDGLNSDSGTLSSLQKLLYLGNALDVTHVRDSLQTEDLLLLCRGSTETGLNILQKLEKVKYMYMYIKVTDNDAHSL